MQKVFFKKPTLAQYILLCLLEICCWIKIPSALMILQEYWKWYFISSRKAWRKRLGDIILGSLSLSGNVSIVCAPRELMGNVVYQQTMMPNRWFTAIWRTHFLAGFWSIGMRSFSWLLLMTLLMAEHLDFKIRVLICRALLGRVYCVHINFVGYLQTNVESVLLF